MPRSMPKSEQQTQGKVARASDAIVADQIAQLAILMPQVMTEGKVDFDKLRETLGEAIDDRPERYSFSWAGKRDAIRALQTPSPATLIPAEGESIGFADTGNVFIEGDNLEVLKLLHKSYFGRVKCIYIDPPYNTGNDFVYPDDFTDPLGKYLEVTGQKDSNGNHLTSKVEKTGRFHSAWLTMMYPRLFLARQLMRDDGVIFVSIDDNEAENLMLAMNEVFGEENMVGVFNWQSKKGGGSDNGIVVNDHEYVVCFGKALSRNTLSRIVIEAEELDLVDDKGAYRRGRELNKWGANSRREDRPTMYFPIPHLNGEDVFPIRNDGSEGCWRWGKKKMFAAVKRGDCDFVRRDDSTYIVYEKTRSTDPRNKPYRTWLTGVGTTADGSKTVRDLFDNQKVFDFAKPVPLIRSLTSMGTLGEEDLILDFFAGSCTTAQAILELNRGENKTNRYICVQVPEQTPLNSEAKKAGYDTISSVGAERIRRVVAKMKSETVTEEAEERDFPEDFGFRFFRLAYSNIHQWKPQATGVADDPQTYIEQMTMLTDPLVEGWTPENVIWEVAIREGFSLSSRVEHLSPKKATKGAKGNTVYQVTDADKGQTLHICLDETVTPDVVAHLGLGNDDLFVCRDIALNDESAANLALQCRLKTL